MREESLPRMLHRTADRIDTILGSAIRRSRWGERMWVALLDAVVGLQSDRVYMRRTILPALIRARPARLLFVGVRGYTSPYARRFRNGPTEFWTSDIDPDAARYGAPGRHVAADVRSIDEHFKPGFFDCVILNGIFGWGVDAAPDMERTLESVARLLRQGGYLLLGWNSDRVAHPQTLSNIALFKAAGFGGLPARQDFSDVTHRYGWFQKQ